MKFERSSGILLHPTSLPGPYGIGDLGPESYRWIDWLSETGCKLWQVLPLGPTGFGDSPYQCFSAFAGNPYLISPTVLMDQGLLTQGDFQNMPEWNPRRVDFGALYEWKPSLLRKAYYSFISLQGIGKIDFEKFKDENSSWLDDYALFMAIKKSYGGGAWDAWPKPLRNRDVDALVDASRSLAEEIEYQKFLQFLFFKQWNALQAYAHQRGIKIIGDIPIFVAMDSSDVWSHSELFYLDGDGKPTVVAGVPPDYFSPTGQLWGNPLYRWDIHKQDGYAWWLQRIRFALSTFDVVRIDHFRGFAGYWEIPASATTAEHGRWIPGPGSDFIQTVVSALGGDSPGGTSLPIIAEDLGEITPDVISLRDQFSLPGMKILQFAFSGPDNPFLPHQHKVNNIVYTGTHDNDTVCGWYESAGDGEKEFARRYFRKFWQNGCEFAKDLIAVAWSSISVYALAPMQDFLCLGTEARFNYPSRLGNNWEWRMVKEDIGEEVKSRIRDLNWLYLR